MADPQLFIYFNKIMFFLNNYLLEDVAHQQEFGKLSLDNYLLGTLKLEYLIIQMRFPLLFESYDQYAIYKSTNVICVENA